MKNNRLPISAIDWLLLLMVIMGVLLAIMSHRAKNDVDNLITTTDTIVINDTIHNWQYDTMYLSRLDTIKLPVVDTINDTIIKIDSILVQIPINTYHYDTTITDTNYKTHLKAVVSGFRCSLDTLCMETEIMQQQPKKQPWYNRLGVGVGLMYGAGGAGVGIGLMYKL